MPGLCGGGGWRFKLTADVERCCLKVMGRLHILLVQECIKTIWNSCLSSIDYLQQKLLFDMRRGFKIVIILKGFEYLEDVICERWILFDFHYLNSLPLERGPFPSINNWHLITYPPHRGRRTLWCEPCSFISTVQRIDRWADRSTIKGIPRGAVNTRSPHTPGMWSITGPAHSRYRISLHPSTSCSAHPVWASLIWVKYSQRITKLSKWHHLKWKERMCSVGGQIAKGGFHQKNLLGLMLWPNITADDDLIHKAHYGSLEMLIISWVTNSSRQHVNSVNYSRLWCIRQIWCFSCWIEKQYENNIGLGCTGIYTTTTYPNNDQETKPVSHTWAVGKVFKSVVRMINTIPPHVRWIIISGDLYNPYT